MATATLKRSWASDLSTATLYELLKLRVEVFVVEQSSAYPELDGRDLLTETRHFWLEENGQVIGTCRLVEEYDEERKSYRIGRLCTSPTARNRGHTTRLLQAALAETGSSSCRINAQVYLVDLYAKHGFKPEGAEYTEAGTTYVPMRRAGGY